MEFSPELKRATLLRRYKRFLADVILDGRLVTVHCPNTGSMTNCVVEGSPCWLIKAKNPARKYPFSWELATTPCGHLAGINTLRANALVAEALAQQRIAGLEYATEVRREVPYGQSRVDFLVSVGKRLCFVEVKSVTLAAGDGLGLFPDTTSLRATKHLYELMACARAGHRAMLLYCVQHTGIDRVAPARTIDPVYAAALTEAIEAGVEVVAYGCTLTPQKVEISKALPVVMSV